MTARFTHALNVTYPMCANNIRAGDSVGVEPYLELLAVDGGKVASWLFIEVVSVWQDGEVERVDSEEVVTELSCERGVESHRDRETGTASMLTTASTVAMWRVAPKNGDTDR